jgi:hypothetical protein
MLEQASWSSGSKWTPVIVGCWLTVLSTACEAKQPSTPRTPTAPTDATAPGVPTVTLSGTIVERSGQPIQGVAVALYPQTFPNRHGWSWPPGSGYQSTPSDSGGRYTTTGIPNDFGSFYVLPSYASGTYVQQCLTTVRLYSDANQDVTLTSLRNLAAGNSQRPPPAPGTRTISGIVFENTAAGRQPIEGAWVGFTVDLAGDVAGAETLSDASGRYLLCGLPETRLTSLFAVKNGHSRDGLWISVDAGSDTTLDIELKR